MQIPSVSRNHIVKKIGKKEKGQVKLLNISSQQLVIGPPAHIRRQKQLNAALRLDPHLFVVLPMQ